MPLYNEICTRHQMIGGREFNTGSVVRTVHISERDAAIMNSMTGKTTKDGTGFEYVKVESKKNESNETDNEVKKGRPTKN